MTYSTINVTTTDFVTTITLQRPERLNALTLDMADELHAALHQHDQDDATRVFVITGAGRASLLVPTWRTPVTARANRQTARRLRSASTKLS